VARRSACSRLGALAVGDQPGGLGLGFGAGVGDAPQLGLGLLALAREVEAALVFGHLRLPGLLRAALGRDALAQLVGALRVGAGAALDLLELVDEAAHRSPKVLSHP